MRMKYKISFGQNQWQKIVFLIVGLILFSLTSTLDNNYFIRNYLLILEIKTILFLFYWLSSNQKKKLNKNKY